MDTLSRQNSSPRDSSGSGAPAATGSATGAAIAAAMATVFLGFLAIVVGASIYAGLSEEPQISLPSNNAIRIVNQQTLSRRTPEPLAPRYATAMPLFMAIPGESAPRTPKGAAEPETKVAPTAIRDFEIRTWTDVTGRHRTQAQLIEAWGGAVYLRRDGKTVSVMAERLSRDDLEYLDRALSVQHLRGRATAVLSGNEFMLVDNSGVEHSIRLAGVAAPAESQPYAAESAKLLASKVLNNELRVEFLKSATGELTAGHVFAQEQWINREMIAAGAAWHDSRQHATAVLAVAEAKARKGGAGLWSDAAKPVPPWEFVAPPPLAAANL